MQLENRFENVFPVIQDHYVITPPCIYACTIPVHGAGMPRNAARYHPPCTTAVKPLIYLIFLSYPHTEADKRGVTITRTDSFLIIALRRMAHF
ncbi:hypothetical protein [Cupriavidus sp. D384]|uniref:hypothetical protein n=1 Tax=Cupriavidus sp. D384 TaxID=1538095 RepID=UPI0012E86753|nr:hypothetical protein [Cupriavidus sp. D384]